MGDNYTQDMWQIHTKKRHGRQLHTIHVRSRALATTTHKTCGKYTQNKKTTCMDMCDPVAGPQLDMREKLCAKVASRANSSNATKRCQGRNLGTKNKKMHQWLVQVAECDGSGLHRGMCRAPHHDTVRVLQEPLPPESVASSMHVRATRPKPA